MNKIRGSFFRFSLSVYFDEMHAAGVLSIKYKIALFPLSFCFLFSNRASRRFII